MAIPQKDYSAWTTADILAITLDEIPQLSLDIFSKLTNQQRSDFSLAQYDAFTQAQRDQFNSVGQDTQSMNTSAESAAVTPTIKARYVYIRKNDDALKRLHLAEVQVFDTNGVNLALGKVTSGKPLFDVDYWRSKNVVDGNTGGELNYDRGFVSVGNIYGGGGWLQIDLGAEQDIASVRVWGSTAPGVETNGGYNGDFTVALSTIDMSGRGETSLKLDSRIAYASVTSTGVRQVNFAASDFQTPVVAPTTSARYVYIRKNDGVMDYLSLAEIQVFDGNGNNLAQGKTVTSSGSFDLGQYKASNAVDGITAGSYVQNGMFASSTAGNGWIQVDLGAEQDIAAINVWGRTDEWSYQNGNYTVYLSTQDMAARSEASLKVDSRVSYARVANTTVARVSFTASTLQTPAAPTTSARYVYIRKNDGVMDYLSLAEIQIFDGNGNNLALGKAVTSGGSYDLAQYKASNAVDGNTNGDMVRDGLFASDTVGNGWIQVDLGAAQNIAAVSVWGRTDNWSYQNGNYTVALSTIDMAGRSEASLKLDSRVAYTSVANTSAAQVNFAISAFQTRSAAPTTSARYVYIRKNEGVMDYLSLAEIQIFDGNGNNLALGKAVTSGGSYDLAQYKASNAVDGNTNGDMVRDGLFASDTAGNGWIQVDLGATQNIAAVSVWGRTDNWSYQNGNYTVYFSTQDMAGRTETSLKLDSRVAYTSVANTSSAQVNIAVPTLTKLSVAPTTSARYVYIRKNDGVTDYLSLAEIQIFDGKGNNLALGKAVTSGGSFDLGQYKASNAVDGNTNGDMVRDGLFASNTAGNGWIQVDLGAAQNIAAVSVWGRTDNWSSQNGNYTVFLSTLDMAGRSETSLKLDSRVAYNSVANTSSTPVSFTVNALQKPAVATTTSARYVYIRKNDGVMDYLSLAEIQVFDGNGNNLAQGKAVTSGGSYDFGQYKASNAVDGNINGDYVRDGIFASETAGNGWIQIDLGAAQDIATVSVWGRTDNWSYQNGNYTVYLSAEDMAGRSEASLKADRSVSYKVQTGTGATATNVNIMADKMDRSAGLTYTGTLNSNSFKGTSGNDTFIGKFGLDYYYFARGDGQDTIIDNEPPLGAADNNYDRIILTDINQTNLWFKHVGNDLQISVLGTSDQLVVKDWYVGGISGADNQIERIKTADGLVMFNTDVEKFVEAMATFAPPSSTQTSWLDGQISPTGLVLNTITHKGY